MNFSIPASPTILDLDHDGFVDRVYVGDVGGQLWKFDTSPAATITSGLVTNWTGKRLFAADPNQANPPAAGAYSPAQAIYGSPAVARDGAGNLWVYVGTGDRNRINASSTNRFYGIKDDTNMTNGSALTEASLVNQTSTNNTVTQGWYFTLGSGEKVIGSADVAENIVYFTSYTPISTVTCTSQGGTAQLYGIQMATGYAGYDWDEGDYITSSSSSEDRNVVVGEGLPTEPNIFLEDDTATVVVGTSSGEFEQVVVPIDIGVQVLYWREVM
jgi:type IV pilus assembly protein PilY1